MLFPLILLVLLQTSPAKCDPPRLPTDRTIHVIIGSEVDLQLYRKTRDAKDRTILLHVDDLDKGTSALGTLHTASGVPITLMQKPKEEDNDPYLTANFAEGVNMKEVLATLLRYLSSDNKSFDRLRLPFTSDEWSKAMIDAIIELKFTMEEADINYGRQPSPKYLLKFFKSTGLKRFTLSYKSPDYPVEFFDEPDVQQMTYLNLGELNAYSSHITEEQLLKLNATYLVLGKAKKLTANSVRRFFQRVFDAKTKETAAITFKRFFQLDFKKLFAGFEAKEWSKQGKDRVWELEAEGRKYEFRISPSIEGMSIFCVKAK